MKNILLYIIFVLIEAIFASILIFVIYYNTGLNKFLNSDATYMQIFFIVLCIKLCVNNFVHFLSKADEYEKNKEANEV